VKTNAYASLLRRCRDNLSSARLFFWLSMLIAAHFYLAAILCKTGFDGSGFLKLNNRLLLDWLLQDAGAHPMVATWLVFTCTLFFILAVNICCRVWLEFESLLTAARAGAREAAGPNRLPLRKIFVFSIHFSFILMISFYGLSSATGFKFLGPAIEKGAVLEHPSLPYAIECLEIDKAAKRMEKPRIVAKPAGGPVGSEFTIPGWHEGVYYDVRATMASPAERTAPGEKPARGLQLNLLGHRFNVVSFVAVLGLWFAGFFGFMLIRFRNTNGSGHRNRKAPRGMATPGCVPRESPAK
jgi:hypothetical protein